jgi:hypothetical protein
MTIGSAIPLCGIVMSLVGFPVPAGATSINVTVDTSALTVAPGSLTGPFEVFFS